MSLSCRGASAALICLASALALAPEARGHDPNADPMNRAPDVSPWRADPALLPFGQRPDGHAPIGVMGTTCTARGR